MWYEPNLWGSVSCPQCGKHFTSDCGVDFCSSSCENEYEHEHAECECCGDENSYLNEHGICENCEMEEIENEAV